MAKQYQTVKFKSVIGMFPKIEGKTLKEITDILGYNSRESCKAALSYWKRMGKLGFKHKNGVYVNFELADEKIKKELEDKSLSEHGSYLKSTVRYQILMNSLSIAMDQTIKAETRQKAEHDALKALSKIPNVHYARLYKEMEE